MSIRWDRTKGRPEPIQALNKVVEVENHEPLVPILDFAPQVKIIRDTVIPYLRSSVARMLHEASLALPEGQYFGVVDAWRPIERQSRIYNFLWESAKQAFPDRNYASLRRTVNRWGAPVGEAAPPGHCTGAAVDVWLVDEESNPIDVSAPFGRFSAAPTYSFGLSPEAHEKRMSLVNSMLGAGFSNCRDEWWHYSYGDAGWAVRMGLTSCFYGIALLNPELYEDLEKLHEEQLSKRQNPFLTGS